MKSLPLKTVGCIFLAGTIFALAASAQFQITPAGRDFSYTISTAQLWTDTGVDLQGGDVLQFHATTSDSCDPAGVSGAATTGLPVVNAPAGALIARLQTQGAPVLIGSSKQLKAD